MSQILADREVKNLLGSVINGTNEDYLNPNGIELRLGEAIKFHSTDEEYEIHPGEYVKIKPGESVSICSLERIDFSPEIIGQLYPGKQLMGWITPTTTMMREGISQVTTKVDSGYKGYLNWSLRNSSFKDLLISHGEPIYKLTLFLLEADSEIPSELYGQRDDDQYQDTKGIHKSARKIDADYGLPIETKRKAESGLKLKDAGFPFDHIADEFEDVHVEFRVIREEIGSIVAALKKAVFQIGTAVGIAGGILTSAILFLGDLGMSNMGVGIVVFVVSILALVISMIYWSTIGKTGQK